MTQTGPRQVLDIENALWWAYRDELPKRRDREGDRAPGDYPSVSPMFRMAATGRVDNWSREPGFPLAMGECHPDAILIEEAVKSLAPEDVDIAGFARVYGTDPIGIDVDIIALDAARQVGLTVAHHARIGERPCHGPTPEVERVRAKNGTAAVFHPVERTLEIGSEVYTVERDEPLPDTKRRGGYYPDSAFCKVQYAPGRIATWEARAEYATWRAGLAVLADRLQGLASILVRPPAAPGRPWAGEGDANRTGVVLRDERVSAPVHSPRRARPRRATTALGAA